MKDDDKKIVTRFPPSPTGNLHIGNIRTLLFNYLFTRKHGGEIVMRFEDTDKERGSKEHELTTLETLKALGLDFDHGPFRQSDRTEIYIQALNTLLEKDAAYIAEESQDEPGENVIRFRNPNKTITFTDLVRGDITIDTTDFGDFVIARSKTSPVYHLSVVVDDMDMNITHVIRGEDHITSTPRQILLIEALGGTIPTYAHLPLIVGEDKKKLGKRHGAVTYQEFERLGYLPEALVNYLALLGWNPGDEREIFTKDELVQAFSFERVNNSPAIFSYEKFDSINKHHLESLDEKTYRSYIEKFIPENMRESFLAENLDALITLVLRERVEKFNDVTEMIKAGELDWFIDTPQYDAKKLLWKDTAAEKTRTHLVYAKEAIEKLDENDVKAERVKGALWDYALKEGKGSTLWPLRYALSGKKKSPDPFTLVEILGKEETLKRLHYAISRI